MAMYLMLSLFILPSYFPVLCLSIITLDRMLDRESGRLRIFHIFHSPGGLGVAREADHTLQFDRIRHSAFMCDASEVEQHARALFVA